MSDDLQLLKVMRDHLEPGPLRDSIVERIQQLTPPPSLYPKAVFDEDGGSIIVASDEEACAALEKGYRLSPPNPERLRLRRDLMAAESELEEAKARIESAQATRDRLAAELANITD